MSDEGDNEVRGIDSTVVEARRYRVEAVTRAAHILLCLQDSEVGDIDSIAARCEAPESFVRSALAALEKHGLARRSEGEWSLGLGWLKLATAGRRQMDLREIAQPIMRRIRDDVDETVILAIVQGRRRVNIDFAESSQDVRRMPQSAFETPLYVGAAGRILLTGLSEKDLRDYLMSVAASDGTVISGLDIEAYIREVEAARDMGYAIAKSEFTSDLYAISAPIRDHAGGVIASLSISYPIDRFTSELERISLAAVVNGARELSALIGFTNDDGGRGRT